MVTKDFTYREAKELLYKHEQLINRLRRVENLCNKEKGHIRSLHKNLIKSKTIEEQIGKEINESCNGA